MDTLAWGTTQLSQQSQKPVLGGAAPLVTIQFVLFLLFTDISNNALSI